MILSEVAEIVQEFQIAVGIKVSAKSSTAPVTWTSFYLLSQQTELDIKKSPIP